MSLQVGIRPTATLVLRADDPAAHFDRAALLLRWIHHQLGLTFEAGQMQQELASAHQRIRALETEASRLHEELHRRIPEVPQDEAQSLHGNHRQQIVRAMLDYLQVHYRQPLHLDRMAGVLKMNANYLSTLFSEMTGVSFHHCLTEIRLARARERLRDPTARVCEVAAAVGYASAEQFTRAFKAHTGLSPRAWREADDGRLPAPPGAGLDI